jgi:hypothetical protein
MAHRTTCTNCCKTDGFLPKLKNRLARIAQGIFAAPDADARRHGWQVTSTRGGFDRQYRDPRFDRLRACSACKGQGYYSGDGTICSACHGTGRIVLDQTTLSERRRGQP